MGESSKKEVVETIGKWVAIALSLATFVWGAATTLRTRAVDARRPFLELQLKLYQEATQSAAQLTASKDEKALAAAEARFWELYWGELAMVENGGIKAANGNVEAAMIELGKVLRASPRDQKSLELRSLALAHACRDSLAESWGVPDWKTPPHRLESHAQKANK